MPIIKLRKLNMSALESESGTLSHDNQVSRAILQNYHFTLPNLRRIFK